MITDWGLNRWTYDTSTMFDTFNNHRWETVAGAVDGDQLIFRKFSSASIPSGLYGVTKVGRPSWGHGFKRNPNHTSRRKHK